MTGFFSREQVDVFRNDTEGCKHVIHLNNAGASLMPDVVTRSIQEHIALESRIGGYEAAAHREAAIARFYPSAARLLNCKPENIAFTTSATDSFIRALSSIPFQAGDTILTDNDDYISNQIQFLSLVKRFGIRLARVRNAPVGGIDIEDLEKQLHHLRPRLLAITHIPTNAGLVQPVLAIGEVYSRYAGIYPGESWYILDACQSVGQMKLDIHQLKCDFLSATTRKFLRGPRGAGFLYVSDRVLQAGLEPLFIDMRGAQWLEKDVYRPRETAMRFEDWEFAYSLLLGSGSAIDYCLKIGEAAIWQQVRSLSAFMRQGLSSIPGIRILDKGPDLAALVTFTIRGADPRYLTEELGRQRINVVPSYREFAVLDFDAKGVDWALRASPHYFNTEEEVVAFLDTLGSIL